MFSCAMAATQKGGWRMERQGVAHGSAEVARLLNIQTSTLRKYAIELEKAGYSFWKNEKGQRGFFDQDILVLRKLMEVKEQSDMTLEKACFAVISTFKEGSVAHSDTAEVSEFVRHDADIQELKELVQKQNLLLQEMAKKLDQQDKRFDEQQQFITNRDQQLMNYIREQQETKRLIAAAEEKKSKSLWNRLFGK